jgi:hypothetical protein
MTVNSELPELFNNAMKNAGFRRRRDNWYRTGPALYALVNLQQSNWDDLIYVNIAFTPVEALDGDWQPHQKCLVRFRVGALKKVTVEDEELLDEKTFMQMAGSTWSTAVQERIIAPILEAFDRASDLSSLAELLRDDVNEQIFIGKEIRSLLGRV